MANSEVKKLWGLILLNLIPFCTILSQNRDYVFTRIDREWGLRSNNVSCVIKDYQGAIWFATNSGLHWFDGQRIVPYINRTGDPTSLPDNRVLKLLEDKHRRFWVVTSNGPSIFDRVHKSFSRV